MKLFVGTINLFGKSPSLFVFLVFDDSFWGGDIFRY